MKTNLGPRLLKALPYIIFIAAAFFIMPIAAAYIEIKTDPGSGILLRAVPAFDCCAALGAGYFYGKIAKRDPILPLTCALVFFLCMLTMLGMSAWIYIFLTALSSYIGQCFGALYYGRFGK